MKLNKSTKNIICLKITLVMTIFSVCFLEETDIDMKQLRKTILESKISVLNKELFTDINYEEYKNMIPELSKDANLVKSYVLEEMYPFLDANYCDEESECKTMMFEIVNHNLGSVAIKKLPTILLIGGFYGNETAGIRMITSMIKIVSKMYMVKRDWYSMLNSVRVLAIPAINMQGFYNEINYESRLIGGKTLLIDPKNDFDLQTNRPCFRSLSAQFLAMIHQDNLIFSSLVLSGSDFEVDYPRMSEVFTSHQTNLDDKIYEDMAGYLVNFFNNVKADETPKLKIEPEEELKGTLRRNSGSCYHEWAYASSKRKKSISKTCLLKTTKFAKKYSGPGENTHRSFVMELNINHKSFVKGPDNEEKLETRDIPFGNELYTILPEHSEAKRGLISTGIIMIGQYLKLIRPEVHIRNTNMNPLDENHFYRTIMQFDFNVKGCMKLGDISIVSEKPTEQKMVNIEKYNQPLEIYDVTIEAMFEKSESLSKSKQLNFEFNIQCNQHFFELKEKYGEPQSLFLLSIIRDDFYVDYNQYSISSLNINKLVLNNVVLDNLKNKIIYSRNPGRANVFYKTNFLFQIGTYFPFTLFYNFKSGKVDFKLNKSEQPPANFKPETENYLIESGNSMRISDPDNSTMIMNLLKILYKDHQEFKMDIFNDVSDFLKKTIKIKSTHLYLDEEESDDDHNHDNDPESDHDHNHDHDHGKFSQKHINEEKAYIYSQLNRFVENFFKIRRETYSLLESDSKEEFLNHNKNSRFNSKIDILKNDETDYFFSLNQKIEDFILPAAFVDLLGRPATVTFLFSPEKLKASEQISISSMATLQKKLINNEKLKLNGLIIMKDDVLTGNLEENTKKPFPSPGNVSDLPVENFIKIPVNGLSCTSIFPFIAIDSADLPHSIFYGLKNNKSSVKTSDFYGLTIIPKIGNDDQAVVTLYVRSKSKQSKYFLHNKKKKFLLKKTNKLMQVQGNLGKYGSEIVIYQDTFPLQELKMSGMYAMVFDEFEENTVFDCFMGGNFKNFDIKEVFTYSVSLNDERKTIKNIINLMREKKKWPYFFKMIFKNPLFWIPLIILACVFFYFKIIDQQEKEIDIDSVNDKELNEPLENKEQKKEQPELEN